MLTHYIYNPTTGELYEADINVNTYYRWANSGTGGRHDIWSAFIHEIGHVLGLGHQDDVPSVIARAVYSGDSKPIRIQSAVSGSELNFTDHYFTQIEVLRGEITDTKRLAVRLEGGLIAGRNEICDDNPKFEKDKEYILCLYNPGGYYEYNTEDEHYYVTGVNQGVFPLTGAQGSFAEKSSAAIVLDETYKRLDGAVTAKDVSFTAESLKSYLLQYNKEVAVNKNHVRETELENAKANLESGFITESEYNDIVNKTALYGKIVTP